jgi:pimeloyl-ACP methyl ester carboxylesterase
MGVAPHIILVHGLTRTRFDMLLLERRLRDRLPHSQIHRFGYRSRKLSLMEATKQLCDFVHTITTTDPVSFVGHSLGGILVRALDAAGHCKPPLHRLVTLGSPHGGAKVARYAQRYRIAHAICGPILEELEPLPLARAPRQLEIGCLVGATRTRFGFFPILGEDNDGLVCVREAHLGSSREAKELFVFHALFPFSARVADLSARFLEHGSF